MICVTPWLTFYHSQYTVHLCWPTNACRFIILEFKEAFKIFDVDNSQTITTEELLLVMKNLGMMATKDEVKDMLSEVDEDGTLLVHEERMAVKKLRDTYRIDSHFLLFSPCPHFSPPSFGKWEPFSKGLLLFTEKENAGTAFYRFSRYSHDKALDNKGFFFCVTNENNTCLVCL